MSAPARIGFIGIGMMGHGMAKNLLAKGYPLTFKANRNRGNLDDLLAAGAKEAKSNAECARAADIVFICVTGSPQVEEIVYGKDGLLEAARPGLLVVDCSTAEPASSTKIRADLAAKGVKLVDAPLARAHSAFVFASFAPAASRSCRLPRLRLALKVRPKPLASRFFAMPWPIIPIPMNPIFCVIAIP